jgi:membrane-bound serine protease (ClpP class)
MQVSMNQSGIKRIIQGTLVPDPVMVILLAFCVWGLLPAASGLFAQDTAPPESALPGSVPKAWVITIRGDIEPSLVTFVRRETRRALSQGADLIIFEIDTFGGRVDSALQITSFIMSIHGTSVPGTSVSGTEGSPVKTVAWVSNSAESMGVSWSAGALIAFSCTDIYMAAGTSIGAAAPVTLGPGGTTEGAGEKAVAAIRTQMAALAERNGYPVGIALAMVDYDVELWEAVVDGRTVALTLAELERLEREGRTSGPVEVERVGMISAPGKLLSLTSGDAYRYGLSAGIANTREALLETLGAEPVAEESAPGFADTVLSIVSSAPVQALLIILGLVMIFLEINSPGFGIFGLVAIIAFAAVFGSGFILGRVGSLELILFLAGIGLLAAEIFVLPGFGIVGISGIIIIGLSLILSMQDFLIPNNDWEWNLLGRNALVVCAGILLAITAIAIIALMGPRIKIFDRLTLHSSITGTAGGPDTEDDYTKLVGKTGKAASTLRPSGKAEIEGRTYVVETEGVFIESGASVAVIRVQGNRVVVGPD